MTGSPNPEPPASAHVVADQSEVFAFLCDPRAHGLTEPVTRIDTHGAVVALAGPYAYKVKRAVRFPFMDYSTLEKRRAGCEAEIAINRVNAPDLYLGKVAITRGPEGLALGGQGEAIEWAVQMRRFDAAATLDRVAAEGRLFPSLLAKVTRAVLASHARAPRREGAPAVESLARYVRENEAAFRDWPRLFPADRVVQLTDRLRHELEHTRMLLLDRGEAGFVRRCHGDLHLRNLVLLDGEPTLFDAIEFDDAVATGDVLYDLAFLLMDLWERDHRESASLVLNRYLWESDEANFSGLAALPLFLALRAGIRAKVVAAGLAHLQAPERRRAAAEAVRYFDCAEQFLDPTQARVVAVGGLSGTGKSTLAAKLAPHLGRPPGAVHLRSDVERKGLFGVGETDRLPPEAYRPEVAPAVYARLVHKARLAVRSGFSVVVDAVHAREEERHLIEDLAKELGVRFAGLWLEAPLLVLANRVERRRADASDADVGVVQLQRQYDPGTLRWRRVDASGDQEELCRAGLEALSA